MPAVEDLGCSPRSARDDLPISFLSSSFIFFDPSTFPLFAGGSSLPFESLLYLRSCFSALQSMTTFLPVPVEPGLFCLCKRLGTSSSGDPLAGGGDAFSDVEVANLGFIPGTNGIESIFFEAVLFSSISRCWVGGSWTAFGPGMSGWPRSSKIFSSCLVPVHSSDLGFMQSSEDT